MRDFSDAVIDNRYHLGDLTGSGSLGVVYRATDRKLQRPVAIKIVPDPIITENELRLLAGLRGHNLSTIIDFDPIEHGFYLVSPWLGGPTVTESVSAEIVPRLQYALDLAEAVAFLHSLGVRHGRIHPGNVRLNSAENDSRLVLTDSNMPLVDLEQWPQATLPYLSPEHIQRQLVDECSDSYSLAAVIYEMISGRKAFAANNVAEAITRHTREQPENLAQRWPDIPPQLDNVLANAFNKSPDRRGTASDLVVALRAALTQISGKQFRSPSIFLAAQAATPSTTPVEANIIIDDRPADRLRIRLRDEEPEEHELTQPIVRLGRADDNDIVLHDNDTALYHVRLEQTSSGWNVVDLGHSAEVRVGASRLVANTPETWLPGVPLDFGEYELIWRSGLDFIDDDRADHDDSISFVTAAVAESAEIVEEIVVSLAPTTLTLAPGDADTLVLSLTNREQIVAHCIVDQSGLPAEWVSFSEQAMQLLPGQTGDVEITVDLTSTPQSLAGAYPFAFTLATSVSPDPVTVVTGIVHVQSNANLISAMEPASVRSPGSVAVTMQNEGNAPCHCVVTARDESNALLFGGLPANVSLDPFRSDRVQVTVAAKSRHLFGTTKVHPFTVSISQDTNEPQNHVGLLEVRPYLPVWLVPVAMLALVFGCAVIAILLVGWNARQQQRTLADEEAALALEVARAEAAANQPTATPGPFAVTCADIVDLTKDDSVLADGEFTIYLAGNAEQPLTVFCYAMESDAPLEYLTVPADDESQNYALTRADGDFYIGTDVVTQYEKVRFDPLGVSVVLTDTTFATSSGLIRYAPEADSDPDSAETIAFTPYATAASCRGGIFPGEANVTLTGLPLQIADEAQFVYIGTDAVGEPVTLSDDRQAVTLVGGGRCGRLAPESVLQLEYIALPSLIGDNE